MFSIKCILWYENLLPKCKKKKIFYNWLILTVKSRERMRLNISSQFLFILQVAALIPMADDFSTEDFCTVVFDEFFFTNISRENVMRHVMKLVWYIHPKLPPARLDTLMKALQPGPHSVSFLFIIFSSLIYLLGKFRRESPMYFDL